jgi:hypothetical protein
MFWMSTVLNQNTIIAFSVSFVISAILLALYFRRYGRAKGSTADSDAGRGTGKASTHGSSAGGKVGTLSDAGLSGSAYTMMPMNDCTAEGRRDTFSRGSTTGPVSNGAGPDNQTRTVINASSVSPRNRRSASSRLLSRIGGNRGYDDWGPMVALGVDLGSYETKAWLYDQQIVKQVGTHRSIVSVYGEGFRFGEVDFAKDFAESTFFSLPQDMTIGADVVLSVGEVQVKPYQACGALLKFLSGDRVTPPVVAVGVPPYLNSFVPDLYLAAMSANLGRFFVFRQCAALMAAILRHRRNEQARVKPARHVVFVDIGRSGIAAYLCEVRETAASLRRETFRYAGVREMERQMVSDLSRALTEEQSADPYVLASIVEAAAEIRYDFASTPAYLLPNAKKSSKTRVTEDLTVEMDRERYDEILELAKGDAEEVSQEIQAWLRLEQVEGQCDLVLSGNGMKTRELRVVFEQIPGWKTILKEKISVGQGLALLAAMRHPKFPEQKYDIDPLFEQQTLDESGLRPVVDDDRRSSGRASILSPLLGRTNSATLGGRSSNLGGLSQGQPRNSTSSFLSFGSTVRRTNPNLNDDSTSRGSQSQDPSRQALFRDDGHN